MRFARSRRTDAYYTAETERKKVRVYIYMCTDKNNRALTWTKQTDIRNATTPLKRSDTFVYTICRTPVVGLFVHTSVCIYFNYGSENLISRFPNGRMQSPERARVYISSLADGSPVPGKLSSPTRTPRTPPPAGHL